MVKTAIKVSGFILLIGAASMGFYMFITEPIVSMEQEEYYIENTKKVINNMKYFQGPNPRLCFGHSGPHMVSVDCELVKDILIK